jgi:hypothetical protein
MEDVTTKFIDYLWMFFRPLDQNLTTNELKDIVHTS